VKEVGAQVSARVSRIIGRKIFHYVRVTSTQDKAKKLAEKGVREGTVIIAETQTHGKGRLGRRWVSPRGGIWLSVILRPEITPMEVPKITMIGSLAVAKAIAELTRLEVKVKWPNDVLIRLITGIGFKKVCGVLSEMVSRVSQVNYVITGLGINVNNRIPSTLRAMATSLKDVIGHDLPKQKLLRKVLEKFDKYYSDFRKQRMTRIIKEYKDMSAVLGKEVKIECPDRIIEGKALDIDEYGALIVETQNGKKRVVAGDMTMLSKI
jgi:BirA family biotin operon repressor/biotin-[acetyl-CoA-carboxylase] ligase